MMRCNCLIKIRFCALSLSLIVAGGSVLPSFADVILNSQPANTGSYSLSDSGIITVDTNIVQNHSDGSGGSIQLNAGRLIMINQGRVLDVSATIAGKNGGIIDLNAPAFLINGTLRANGMGGGRSGIINLTMPAMGTSVPNYLTIGPTARLETDFLRFNNHSGNLVTISAANTATYYNQSLAVVLSQAATGQTNAPVVIEGDGLAFAGMAGNIISFTTQPGTYKVLKTGTQWPDESVIPLTGDPIHALTGTVPDPVLPEGMDDTQTLIIYDLVPDEGEGILSENPTEGLLQVSPDNNPEYYFSLEGSTETAQDNGLHFTSGGSGDTTASAIASASTGDIEIAVNLTSGGTGTDEEDDDQEEEKKNKKHIKEFKHTVEHHKADKGKDKSEHNNLHIDRNSDISENIRQEEQAVDTHEVITNDSKTKGEFISTVGDNTTVQNIEDLPEWLSSQLHGKTPASVMPATGNKASDGNSTTEITTITNNNNLASSVINNNTTVITENTTTILNTLTDAPTSSIGDTSAFAEAVASTGDISIAINLDLGESQDPQNSHGKDNGKGKGKNKETIKEFTHIIEHIKDGNGNGSGDHNNIHIKENSQIARDIVDIKDTANSTLITTNTNSEKGDTIRNIGGTETIENITYLYEGTISSPSPVTPIETPPQSVSEIPGNTNTGNTSIKETTLTNNNNKSSQIENNNVTTIVKNNTIITRSIDETENDPVGNTSANALASASTGDVDIVLNLLMGGYDWNNEGGNNTESGTETEHIKEFTHTIIHSKGNGKGDHHNVHIKENTEISENIFKEDRLQNNTETTLNTMDVKGDTIFTQGITTIVKNITYLYRFNQPPSEPGFMPVSHIESPDSLASTAPDSSLDQSASTTTNATNTNEDDSSISTHDITNIIENTTFIHENENVSFNGSGNTSAVAQGTASTGNIDIAINLDLAGSQDLRNNDGKGNGKGKNKETLKEFTHIIEHIKDGNGSGDHNNIHIKENTQIARDIVDINDTANSTITETNNSSVAGDTVTTIGDTLITDNTTYLYEGSFPTSSPVTPVETPSTEPGLGIPGNTTIKETTITNNSDNTSSVENNNVTSITKNMNTEEGGNHSGTSGGDVSAMGKAVASTGDIDIEINLPLNKAGDQGQDSDKGNRNKDKDNKKEKIKEITHIKDGKKNKGEHNNIHITKNTEISENIHQESHIANTNETVTNNSDSKGDTTTTIGDTTSIKDATFQAQMPQSDPQFSDKTNENQDTATGSGGNFSRQEYIITNDNTTTSSVSNNSTTTITENHETLSQDSGTKTSDGNISADASAIATTGNINISLNLGSNASEDNPHKGSNEDKDKKEDKDKASDKEINKNTDKGSDKDKDKGNRNNNIHIKENTQISNNVFDVENTSNDTQTSSNTDTAQGDTIRTRDDTTTIKNADFQSTRPTAPPSAALPAFQPTTNPVPPTIGSNSSSMKVINTNNEVATSSVNDNNTTVTTNTTTGSSQKGGEKLPPAIGSVSSNAEAVATTGNINIQLNLGTTTNKGSELNNSDTGKNKNKKQEKNKDKEKAQKDAPKAHDKTAQAGRSGKQPHSKQPVAQPASPMQTVSKTTIIHKVTPSYAKQSETGNIGNAKAAAKAIAATDNVNIKLNIGIAQTSPGNRTDKSNGKDIGKDKKSESNKNDDKVSAIKPDNGNDNAQIESDKKNDKETAATSETPANGQEKENKNQTASSSPVSGDRPVDDLGIYMGDTPIGLMPGEVTIDFEDETYKLKNKKN